MYDHSQVTPAIAITVNFIHWKLKFYAWMDDFIFLNPPFACFLLNYLHFNPRCKANQSIVPSKSPTDTQFGCCNWVPQLPWRVNWSVIKLADRMAKAISCVAQFLLNVSLGSVQLSRVKELFEEGLFRFSLSSNGHTMNSACPLLHPLNLGHFLPVKSICHPLSSSPGIERRSWHLFFFYF